MPTIKFTYETDEGEEKEVDLPAVYEVCDECRGEGKHCNRNIDGNGITAEEWERDWDEDSREAYLSGRYDVPCEMCGGKRVVAVVDDQACDPDLLRRYHERLEGEAIDRAAEMTERRYCGGY